ncbi:MAG: crossover junction endodeoxyribonuclease RuvC [Phycisphaerae bacterium]|nr:crossover junction endodeoxyribonuclease RuvC [Phycisphaerae bacterium]
MGIDPGLRVTGYGCVEGDPARLVEAGVFRLRADEAAQAGGEAVSARLEELDADLRGAIERLRPEAAAVEAIFAHYKHPATAIAMAHARGVILLNIRRAGLRLVEFKPNAVKKFLTGHGHASKEQMQEAVRSRLGLPARPEPADVADAIAIALCAAWRGVDARTGG